LKRNTASHPERAAGRADRRPGIPHHDQSMSPQRSIWRRLALAPGVELQIAGNVRLPSPGRLQELAEWCRLHLVSTTDPKDEANDA
jgi:hypothetical protein